MLPKILLFSTAPIDTIDFHYFLRQLGANIRPALHYDDGELVQENQYLLIGRDREIIWRYSRDQPEQFATICELLRGSPQTCVVVDFTREPGGDILALEFASLLNRQWPIVAVDAAGMIYTSRDIFLLRKGIPGFRLATDEAPPELPGDGERPAGQRFGYLYRPRRRNAEFASSTLQRAVRRSQSIHFPVDPTE